MANEKVLIGVKLDYENELNGLINKLKGIEKDEIRLPLKLDANVSDDIKRITTELQKMSKTLSSAFNFAPAEKLDAVFASLSSRIKSITTSSGALASGKEYQKLLKGVSYYKSLGGDMGKLYDVTNKKNVKSIMKDIEASDDLKKYPANILDAYNKINSLKPLDLQDLFTGKLDLEKVKAMEEELRGVSEILQHVFTPNVGKQAVAGVDNVGGIVLPDVDKIKAGIAEINNLRAELEKLQTATKGIGKISNALKTLGDVTFTELSIPQEFISSLSTLNTAIPDASKADSLRILSNALSKLNGSLFGNLENFKLSSDFHTMISELGKLSSVTEELKALAEASKYLNSTGGNFVSLENFEKNNSKWVSDWESKYLNKKKDDGTPYYTATGQTEIERTTQGMVRLTTVVQEADGAYKKLIGTVTTAGEVMLTAQKKAKSSDTGGVFSSKDTDKLEEHYKNALKYAEKYAAIQAKDAKGLYIGKSEKDFVEEMKTRISEISDFEKELGSGVMDHLGKGTAKLRDKYMSQIVNVEDSLNFSKFTSQLSEEKDVVESLNSKFLELIGTLSKLEGSQDAIEKVEQEYAKLMNRFAKGNIGNNYDLLKDFGKFYNKFENVAGFYTGEQNESNIEAELKKYIRAKAGSTDIKFNKVSNPLSGDNMKMTGEYVDKVTGKVKTMTATFEKSNGVIRVAETTTAKYVSGFNQFIDSLNNKLASVAKYLMAYVTLQDIWRYFKQGVSTVKEFDTALTEMRKVSDETLTSLKSYQKESFDLADNVGTTALQLQKSTADFMRLGNTLEQAKQNAQTANVLFNVSEFESIEEATNSLISMEAAYRNLSGTEIIDKLNNIGNHFAISTDGIAAALQRSGSALTTASNDIDESTAMIAAANTVVQDPEKVGNGLRTIALRLTGTKAAAESLQEMGEETEGMIQTESKLRKTIMDATKTMDNPEGFDILDNLGQYKSTYEILQGIADIWEDIGEMDKATGNTNQNLLLETMAGKNRANILAAILQSPDILRSAYISSQNSEGSAQEELDKYLESMEGKIQRFKNAAQELSTDILNSDLLKFFIDLGTTGVSALDALAKHVDLLTVGFSALVALGAKKTGFDLIQFAPDEKGLNKFKPIWAQMKERGGLLELEKSDENYGKFISSMRAADKETVTFSGHYKDLLKMGSIKKIDLAEEFRKDISEGGNYQGVFDDSLEGYNAWYKATKEGNDELRQSFANLGTSIASFALSTAASLGAAWVTQIAVQWLSDNVINRTEVLIEKGKEARNTVKEISNAMQDSRNTIRNFGEAGRKAMDSTKNEAEYTSESIEYLAERYTELRRGTQNNANMSLTDDEYQEFLDISNKLAEIMPSLQYGTDSSGNAILDLGNNAYEAAQKVKELYGSYQDLNNGKIRSNVKDSLTGFLAEFQDLSKTSFDLPNPKMAKQWLDAVGAGYNGNGLLHNVGWEDMLLHGDEIVDVARQTTLQLMNDDSITEDAKAVYADRLSSFEAMNLQYKEEMSSIIGFVEQYISATDIFGDLSYNLQQDVSSGLRNVQDELKESYVSVHGDTDAFITELYKQILLPLNNLDTNPDVQKQVHDLLSLDISDMSFDDVSKKYSEVLTKAFGDTYVPNQEIFNKIFDIQKYQDIQDKFNNMVTTNRRFAEDDLAKMYENFSLGEMQIAYNVLLDDNERVINSYEKLKEAVDKTGESLYKETSYLNDYTASQARAHSAQYDAVKDAVAAESTNMARGIKNTDYTGLIGGVDLAKTVDMQKIQNFRTAAEGYFDEIQKFNDIKKEVTDAGTEYDFNRTLFGNVDLDDTNRKIEWTTETVDKFKYALESWDLKDIIKDVGEGKSSVSTVLGTLGSYYTQSGEAVNVAFTPMFTDQFGSALLDKKTVDNYMQTIIGNFETADEITLPAVLEFDTAKMIADVGDTASITDRIMHFLGVNGSINLGLQQLVPYMEQLNMSWQDFANYTADGELNVYGLFEAFDTQQRAMTYFTDDGLGIYAFMKDVLTATSDTTDEAKDLRKAFVDVGKDGKVSFKKNEKSINALSKQLNISTESAGYLLDAAKDIGAIDIGTIYAQAGKNTLNGFISDLQAVAAAMSEISQNGYMTYDTMTNLVAANGAYADGLVNTSSGMILNNDVMRELNEQAAEYATADIQGSIEELNRRYEVNTDTLKKYNKEGDSVVSIIQKIKEANGELDDATKTTGKSAEELQEIWSAYTENESIGNTILDLQRQQSEIRASVSLMQEYKNALTTPNMNANYLATQSGKEGADKLFKQGWLGTDDFITYAKLIGQNGMSDEEAILGYQANAQRMTRYLTESALGVHNFFDDAIAKGEELGVTFDEVSGYKLDIKNMEEFAKQMDVTTEFAENMILALHDTGQLDVDLSMISDGLRKDLSEIGKDSLGDAKKLEDAYNKIMRMGDTDENALNKIIATTQAQEAKLNGKDVAEQIVEQEKAWGDQVIEQDGRVVASKETVQKAIGGLSADVQKFREETDAESRTNLFKTLQTDVRALSSLDIGSLSAGLGIKIDENATRDEIIDAIATASDMTRAETLSLKLGVEIPEDTTDEVQDKLEKLYESFNKLNELKANPKVETGEITAAQDTMIDLAQTLQGEVSEEVLARFGIVVDEQGVIDVEATKQNLGQPVQSSVTVYTSQDTLDRLNALQMIVNDIGTEHNGEIVIEGTEEAREEAEGLAEYLAELPEEQLIAIGFDTSKGIDKQTILNQIGNIDLTANIKALPTVGNNQTVQVTVNGAKEGAQDVDKLNSSLTALSQFGALSVNINTAAALGAIAGLQGVLDALGATVTQPTVSMALANFYSDAKVVDATLNGISKQIAQPHVSMEYGAFRGGASDVRSQMAGLSGLSAYPRVSLSGGSYVLYQLNNIRSDLNSLDGKTARTYVETVKTTRYNNGTGQALGTVHAHASGTANAYAGGTPNNADIAVKHNETDLVNELGYESIVRNGKWSLIPGGAHFTQLKKGDIIFNAEQTKELIENGRVLSDGGRGKLALASGTVNAYAYNSSAKSGGGKYGSIVNLSRKNSGASSSSSSSSSSSRSGNSGNGNSSSKAASDAKDTAETFDWIEIKIDRLEREIEHFDTVLSSTYQNWGARNNALTNEIKKTTEEIKVQYKQANNAYKRYIQEANKVSLSENYRKLVRDGAIDISTIKDEKLAENIKNYQEWYLNMPSYLETDMRILSNCWETLRVA